MKRWLDASWFTSVTWEALEAWGIQNHPTLGKDANFFTFDFSLPQILPTPFLGTMRISQSPFQVNFWTLPNRHPHLGNNPEKHATFFHPYQLFELLQIPQPFCVLHFWSSQTLPILYLETNEFQKTFSHLCFQLSWNHSQRTLRNHWKHEKPFSYFIFCKLLEPQEIPTFPFILPFSCSQTLRTSLWGIMKCGISFSSLIFGRSQTIWKPCWTFSSPPTPLLRTMEHQTFFHASFWALPSPSQPFPAHSYPCLGTMQHATNPLFWCIFDLPKPFPYFFSPTMKHPAFFSCCIFGPTTLLGTIFRLPKPFPPNSAEPSSTHPIFSFFYFLAIWEPWILHIYFDVYLHRLAIVLKLWEEKNTITQVIPILQELKLDFFFIQYFESS